MYVVSVSGAYGATMLHGPFPSSEAAYNWADINVYKHFRFRVVNVVPTDGEYGTARPVVNIAPEQHSVHVDHLDSEREPTDDEIYNRHGVEGGIAYDTTNDEPGSLGENDWRL